MHKESFWRWKNRLNYGKYSTIDSIHYCGSGSCYLRNFLSRSHLQADSSGIDVGLRSHLHRSITSNIQTTILLPQLLENLKQSRVKGVSYTFVLLNTAQDVNELLFVSVIEPQPLQFILLNGVQSLADLLLITQIIFYKLFHKPII